MITAIDIYEAELLDRKELILAEIRNVDGQVANEIELAREISNVLNLFLSDYFAHRIEEDNSRADGSILITSNMSDALEYEIEQFKPLAIEELKSALPTSEELISSFKNVYEMSGAIKLSFANKATRNLSTTMGLLWERLASISPYAINPEIEFNLKVKGIDLIAQNFHNGKIEYQQLKTQHNTLTGSQRERSIEELQIHSNPVFCACFANKSSWTFNHPDIPRVSGIDFWSRLGISYDLLLAKVKALILVLEDEYVKLL
jgi:hypothetical protein